MDSRTISDRAAETPDKAAAILGDGSIRTYAELDAAANRGGRALRAAGLGSGDVLAMCLENGLAFFDVAWAAARCGLTLVPVSSRLTAAELEFIVADSGAKALVTSAGVDAELDDVTQRTSGVVRFMVGGERAGFRSWDRESSAASAEPITDGAPGSEMLYSSGTTGRPKGIRHPASSSAGGVVSSALRTLALLGAGKEAVYLSPAPLYHAAPFAWSLAVQAIGGTVVAMERFDPELALALIERHKVTLSQWVPTHFVRLLKLPEEVRARYNLSSLRLAVHAAAPCPVPIKREMIDWWGPILLEYYGSTEHTALTLIDSGDWLDHPGSVGKSRLGVLHICDEAGEPLPPGTVGQVYVEGGPDFRYHNDPGKTAASRNRHGWTTVGDIGFLDEEGYLYLTDRKNFMIITGGVNVYPQEIENLLVTHPGVVDAAVIGTPHPDLGEQVTAIIQPVTMDEATPAFAAELQAWLRRELSGVKAPKRVEFRADLPRLPTGKLAKHLLREDYS